MLSPSYAAEPQIQQLSQLLRDIAAGHLQVPRFQRPPVWTATQRLELLRSVAQGLPIGSILVWRTIRTDLQTVPTLGPHRLPDVPQGSPVRSYVLDGLQRLSTLYGALYPREGQPKDEGSDWDIYYRLEDRDFSAGPAPSPLPPTWLPLWLILDSPTLLRFQRKLLQDHADREHWLTSADALQKVLLEYKIPVIPFVTDDLDRATLAFQRINSHFTPMSMPDMLAALTYREGSGAFNLREQLAAMRSRLVGSQWEEISDQTLLDACKAALGLRLDASDVEATAHALIQPGLLGVYDEVAKQLSRAAQLLTRNQLAGPALLAAPSDMTLLTEALHSGCNEHELWRWYVYHLYHGETQLADELEEVRTLTEHLPWEVRRLSIAPLPSRFDFRSRRGKALALVFLSCKPFHAGAEELVNAPEVLAHYGDEALPRIVPTGEGGEGIDGPENRMVCRPDEAPVLRARLLQQTALCSDEMLRSHLIDAAAKEALLRNDRVAFLHARRREIERTERFFLYGNGLSLQGSAIESDSTGSWSQRVVLRLSRLRQRRPALALALAKAAVERRPTPELLSDLAQAIILSRRRPFHPPLPVQMFRDRQLYWPFSQDGGRALIGPGFLHRAATVLHLEEGSSIDLEGTKDVFSHDQMGSFSPDGTLVATVDSERDGRHGLRLWDAATGRLLAQDKQVHSRYIEFSPDGTQILAYRSGDIANGPDGEVVLWSKERGAQVLYQAVLPRAQFSPDGRCILLSSSRSPKVTILSLADASEVHLSPPDVEPVSEDHGIARCVFSPDGTRVLTCSEGTTGRIWGTDGQLQAVFLSHRAGLSWGDWHPDGASVATLDEHGSGWIWDVSGKAMGSFKMDESGSWGCAWNRAGSRLMVYNFSGGRVYIFDRDGQRLAALDDDDEAIHFPHWHSDGVTVYGRSGGTLRRWSSIETPLAALSPDEIVNAVGFSPDGSTVMTVHSGTGMTLWSLDGHVLLDLPVPKASHQHVVSFSPDGTRFLTVSHSEGVKVVDQNGATTARLRGHEEHQWDALRANFGPQGDRILTTSNDGAALLWSVDGEPQAILGDHHWGVPFGAFSPDGRRVMTVDAHDTLRLWSTEGPFLTLPSPTEQEGTHEGPDGRFGAYDQHGRLLKGRSTESTQTPGAKLLGICEGIARSQYVGRWPSFSPDGNQIIFPNGHLLNGHGKAWPNRVDGVRSPPAFGKNLDVKLRAVDARFSPDGQKVATAHADAARVWNRDGRLLLQLAQASGPVWLVRFSPDSHRLMTVTERGTTVQIWDADSGELFATLPGPGDPILDAMFSPDGRYVLVHAARALPGWGVLTKGYAWIWPADLAGLLALAEARIDHEPTQDELHLYLQ